MSWIVGGLSALGSIVGFNESSDAASDATRAQTQAANRELDIFEEIYADSRQLNEPFYQAGLQGLYGNNGVMNLMGFTQPGGTTSAPAVTGQPANAFANYASGSYGAQTPAQQQTNQWQSYLDANPDVMLHYTTENVAVSPHLLRGGGRGSDTDGDGRISPEEWAAYHYNTVGRGEGRGFGETAPAPAPQPVNAFDVVDTGGGRLQPGTGPQTALPSTGTPTEGSMTATLRQTPGYEFLIDESRRAIENSAAARGELLSGAAVNAVNERTLGLADQTYQRTLDNAFRLSGVGQGAAANNQSAGNYFSGNSANAFGNIGQAQAQGAYGQANAFNTALQGVLDAGAWTAGQAGWLNNDQKTTPTQTSGSGSSGWMNRVGAF